MLLLNFNSIKVQLEPCNRYCCFLLHVKFQFHKGTIRTEAAGLNPYLMMEFQFHKGTIRTTDYVDDFVQMIHFNSIKVQLEQAI